MGQKLPHNSSFTAQSLTQKSLVWRAKQLDFLLLAGCSCLLTLLYHPVAEALSSSQQLTHTTPAAMVMTEPQICTAISPFNQPKADAEA